MYYLLVAHINDDDFLRLITVAQWPKLAFPHHLGPRFVFCLGTELCLELACSLHTVVSFMNPKTHTVHQYTINLLATSVQITINKPFNMLMNM